MKKIDSFINSLYGFAVATIATAVLSLLFFISFISTCFRASDSREITYFCSDSWSKNLIFIVMFLLVLIVACKIPFIKKFKDKLEEDNFFTKVKRVILAVIFGASFIWVIGTQFIPGSDQLDALDCAYKIGAREFNMLEPGGYLNKWTNQAGAVAIDYLLAKLWGDFNITAFQVLNVVGITLLYKKMADILEETGVSRITQVMTLFSGLVFFPLIMYTSFVYGTIWHVTLSLLAFHSVLKYLKDYKWWRVILSSVYLALAIQVKNNALIFLVAIVIYILINMFRSKGKEILLNIALLFFGVMIITSIAKIPKYIIQKETGYRLDQGVTSLAWVAMGLQESEEEFPPGWWNGYNNQTYADSDYNTEIQKEVCKKDIVERLELFKKDKAYAVNFFSRKIASMWSEPTFQCYWINQIRNHRVMFTERMDKFFSAEGYTNVAGKLDYLQLIFYLGALLWLIFGSRENFRSQSFFILSFIGGFMFHLMWEAKTQYSVTYTVLLIPCVVMGLESFVKKINSFGREGLKSALHFNHFYGAVCVVTIIAVAMIYRNYGSGCLTAQDQEYKEYLESWSQPVTNESVLQIEELKGALEYDEGMMVYYNHLLQINGISY